MAENAVVAVLVGSDSDLPTMQGCMGTLAQLGIPYRVQVASAHRSPERVRAFARGAREAGVRVVIAAAGGAAHLAGAVAAETTLPVIGVPLASSPLSGVDALYATVNMPPGVPVATVSVGAWGAINAAVLAAEILALSDAALAGRLAEFRREAERQVDEKNRRLAERGEAGAGGGG